MNSEKLFIRFGSSNKLPGFRRLLNPVCAIRYPTEGGALLSDKLKNELLLVYHCGNLPRHNLLLISEAVNIRFLTPGTLFTRKLDLIFSSSKYSLEILNELEMRDRHSFIHIILHFYEILNLTLKYDKF